jgi:hypothetical protein
LQPLWSNPPSTISASALSDVFTGALPYVLIMVIVLVLVVIFPQISLILVRVKERKPWIKKIPLSGFQVDRADIRTIGHDLQRPECILAEPDGTLWSADARGGVVKISPDGSQEIITQSYGKAFESAADEASRFTEGTLPNGLAFAENGDILISNFGTDSLEVMTRSGRRACSMTASTGSPSAR